MPWCCPNVQQSSGSPWPFPMTAHAIFPTTAHAIFPMTAHAIFHMMAYGHWLSWPLHFHCRPWPLHIRCRPWPLDVHCRPWAQATGMGETSRNSAPIGYTHKHHRLGNEETGVATSVCCLCNSLSRTPPLYAIQSPREALATQDGAWRKWRGDGTDYLTGPGKWESHCYRTNAKSQG